MSEPGKATAKLASKRWSATSVLSLILWDAIRFLTNEDIRAAAPEAYASLWWRNEWDVAPSGRALVSEG